VQDDKYMFSFVKQPPFNALKQSSGQDISSVNS
jgi:hypothetical protein